MATLSRGQTFGATETITNTKLHALVDSGSVTGIANADCDSAMALDNSKLANIEDSGKVKGSSFYGLDTIPSGAGLIPQEHVLPAGFIGMWSGAISAIPTGWVICDGTNSTPNLTDRFVIHADADSGGTNNVGDTGGANSVTLTHEQSGIPAHTHPITTSASNFSGSFPMRGGVEVTGSDNVPANTAADASESHENRPAFYALAYIMKT